MSEPSKTYDPGGEQGFDYRTWDPGSPWPDFPEVSRTPGFAEAVSDFVVCHIQQDSLKSSMHRAGLVILKDNTELPVASNLFDSGSLHANFVSQEFVDTHRTELASLIHPYVSSVRLGDSKTVKPITEVIFLTVRFMDSTGNYHQAMGAFHVFSTGQDLIIGLPLIVSDFSDLFHDMVRVACMDHNARTLLAFDMVQLTDADINLSTPVKGDFLDPWKIPRECCEEEDMIPMPVTFETPLYYLEVGHEQAVRDFRALLDSHVAKDFPERDQVIQLLSQNVDCFIPKDWKGLNIEPIHMEFSKDMPASYKPPYRPYNPKLLENADREFKRLEQYMYTDYDGPISHPQLVAAKETYPFVRFVTGYDLFANKHIVRIQTPIPDVPLSLQKIRRFTIFCDVDGKNAFHQVPLDYETSCILSVQTKYGQKRPLFLPEGIANATGILQNIMRKIFEDFDEWTIVIHDNMLLLGHDVQDMLMKLRIFLQRCRDYNLCLKIEKSWFFFGEANFFGYHVDKSGIELTKERKDTIMAMPFPVTRTDLQRFLGCTVFFHRFCEDFSKIMAPLGDMLHKDFNWDQKTWKRDYRADFIAF